MKDCRKYEALLARYMHGDSLLQDREFLEKHLAVCPDCERLYGEVSEVDRLLRDLPGKQVDPPPWLHGRILASLPEGRNASSWVRWGRWAAAAGTLVACALAIAFTVFRGGVPRDPRVASAPPSVLSPPSPQAAAPDVPAAETRGKPDSPVLKPSPGARRRGAENDLASAPPVRVIREVKIFFYYPPAQKVAVTGDFNDWNVDGVPMQAAGKPGLWTTELQLPPGVYSYNFIVDGERLLPDPNAPNQMPDGYGGTNSLLLVRGERAI